MKAAKAKQALNAIIDNVSLTPGNLVRNPGKDFTRDRKLPLKLMLRILIGMQGGTIWRELNDYDNKINVSSSAFIQQRDKILPEMLEHIFRQFNQRLNLDRRYRGYQLLAVDGSTITIAKNKNSETYVPVKDEKLAYNAFHLNAFFDLLNKSYTDVIITPEPQRHEVKAAISMIRKLPTKQKVILLGDRGYGSLNLLEHIHRRKDLEYLIRVRNSWLTETKNLPMADLDTDISFELRTTQTKEDRALRKAGKIKYISAHAKPGQAKMQESWEFESPFRMKLRIVRFRISTGEYETIVTSLNRNRFPASEIKALYHLRWGIETSFRDLKYAVGLTQLHAKKEAAALQEIYARLIMYNYSQSIIMDVVIEQKEDNKWLYRVNTSSAIHLCRQYYRFHGAGPPPAIEPMIAQKVEAVRPGRSDRRKKDKQKDFVWFMYRVA